jgi:VanZ family protein
VINSLVRVARAQQHNLGIAATIVMLVVIARLTLYPAPGPLPSGFHTCVMCGTFGTADLIDNVILFVPLGAAMRLAGVRRRKAWLITLGLAIGIETAQDWVVSGRESSLSDLISNPLGGALGIALADCRRFVVAPGARLARWMAGVAALGLVAFTACIAWTLHLSIPRAGAYWTQVGPNLPQFVPFEGPILAAMIDGFPVSNGRVDSATTAAIRAALRGGSATIEAQAVPHASSDRLAPLITIYDQWKDEILVLGCRRGGVMFRARTRTETLRVHPVSFEGADGCAVGDTITITAQPLDHGGRVQLTAVARGQRTISTIGTGVWLGWRLLVPDDGWWSDLARLLTLLWMAILLAPITYWSARADRERAGTSGGTALVIVAVLALILAAIPMIAGSTPAPLWAWLGASGGAAVGWMLAQWDRAATAL